MNTGKFKSSYTLNQDKNKNIILNWKQKLTKNHSKELARNEGKYCGISQIETKNGKFKKVYSSSYDQSAIFFKK